MSPLPFFCSFFFLFDSHNSSVRYKSWIAMHWRDCYDDGNGVVAMAKARIPDICDKWLSGGYNKDFETHACMPAMAGGDL